MAVGLAEIMQLTALKSTVSEETIHGRLREARKKKGLTHDGMAALCGVSRRTAIDWERGVKIPPEALAKLLAAGFDIYLVLAGAGANAPHPVVLTADEVSLLDQYRDLPPDRQPLAQAMMTAMHQEAVRNGVARSVRDRVPNASSASVQVTGTGNVTAAGDIQAGGDIVTGGKARKKSRRKS